MKLRLTKDSLRLRVLRSEVNALASGSRLQETIAFGPAPADHLTYTLESSPTNSKTGVAFVRNELAISIPVEQLIQWASSDEVGIYVQIEVDPTRTLKLLVEKDFACLDRSDAENADTYQNPKMNC